MKENENCVLVTGAGGFLGRHLVQEALRQGYRVRAMVRRPPAHLEWLRRPEAAAPVQWVEADLTDPAAVERAMKGCDCVIHAGAYASVNPARSAAHWRVNRDGTAHVLQAARRHGIQRLVYVGTANVFGFGTLQQPGNERVPYAGERYGLDYMNSKRAAADLVEAAAREGLPALLVHPTFMLGPQLGANLTSGAMLTELARGTVPGYPPGGKNYVHVRDVATATVNALHRGTVGESYLLGHENLSYRDAFRLMADVLGVRPPALPLPAAVVRTYGYLSDRWSQLTGTPARVNGAMARVSCDGHYFDCSRAVRELGLPQTPIRQAMEEAAAELFSAKT